MIQRDSRIKWERPGLPPGFATVTDVTTNVFGHTFYKAADEQGNRFVFHEDVVTEVNS